MTVTAAVRRQRRGRYRQRGRRSECGGQGGGQGSPQEEGRRRKEYIAEGIGWGSKIVVRIQRVFRRYGYPYCYACVVWMFPKNIEIFRCGRVPPPHTTDHTPHTRHTPVHRHRSPLNAQPQAQISVHDAQHSPLCGYIYDSVQGFSGLSPHPL